MVMSLVQSNHRCGARFAADADSLGGADDDSGDKPLAAEQFTVESARAAAEKGNPKALYFLGKRYAKGEGVPQDYAKAAEYLRKSAEKGFAPGAKRLGRVLRQRAGGEAGLCRGSQVVSAGRGEG